MENHDIEALYMRYAQSVYRYLLSLTHCAHTAEELTQETFYQAIRSSNKYDASCKVSVWLCQIAKHKWYQYLRKEKKYIPSSENTSEPLTAPLEKQLMEQENLRELYTNIHALEEPYREVIYLRTLANLSFRQIGDAVGQSETWARVTFFRAKKKLMERMQNNENNL